MLEVSAQSSVKIVPFPYSVVFKQKKDLLHFFQYMYCTYTDPKGTVPRDFRLLVFYESVSPKPLSIPFGGEASEHQRATD